MQSATGLTSAGKFLGIVAVLCWSFSVFLIPANAQNTKGQNAVYNSSGTTVGSSAFIDASMFASSQNPNICAVLHSILNSTTYPASGAVIDARGLPGSTGTSMICTASPWAGIANPSTILLPAATITIPGTWALPSNTKLIGEGYGTTGGTMILAASFTIGNPMIQFGPFSCPNGPCYTGISVENLMLNGAGQNINGIQNSLAQSSYVDHVTFFQILGTGVQIGAPNSGPYTNITFDSGSSALSSTTCVNINGATSTQGIRGITCIAGTNATTAIYLDASNNSLKDVRIAGFYDGILVGSQASAQSNALFNIFGDTIQARGIQSPINVVHIYSGSNTVTDLSIMGINNAGGSGTNTIEDDLTSPSAPLPDPYVAMYVLGEPLKNGNTLVGYSRFTTSPNATNWSAGANPPTAGSACGAPGSLYSNTSGSGKTLYACTVNLTWQSVK
jgi:hypothetical protein